MNWEQLERWCSSNNNINTKICNAHNECQHTDESDMLAVTEWGGWWSEI